jgi:DTW domain-containing protein
MLPRLATRTRVALVIHYREDRKPTNTGRLASECLTNSEVHVRGRMQSGFPEPAFALDPSECEPLLLFPHEDAVPLHEHPAVLRREKPVTLIVPDGTWRQASKVRKRVPGLAQVPCVTLPFAEGEALPYQLRAEAHETGMATMAAIARALGILEGPEEGPMVQRALEHVLRVLIDRTLWCRGALDGKQVYGGLPEAATREISPASATGLAEEH